MTFTSIIWDHAEWSDNRKAPPVLRARLEKLRAGSWDTDFSRGCKVCGSMGFKPGPVNAIPSCSCWNSNVLEQRFVLWYHAPSVVAGPQHFSNWLGHERLVAVVRLTVRGWKVTLPWPPSTHGTSSPFLAIHLQRPLMEIDDSDFKEAIFVLEAALSSTVKQSDLLDGFRRSPALQRNNRAATLWNAVAPNPVDTFSWSVLMRHNDVSAAAKVAPFWVGMSPYVQDVPVDLLAEYEMKGHGGQLTVRDVDGVANVVQEWFDRNRSFASFHGVKDDLWDTERGRVTARLQEIIRVQLGASSVSGETTARGPI